MESSVKGGISSANVGDVLTIKYMPGETTGYYPKTLSGYNVLKWSRFVKWRFYCLEPFSTGPYELNEETVLLNNCNSPSTMIKIPNTAVLLIKPEIAVIPSRISVRDSYIYQRSIRSKIFASSDI